MLPGRKTPKKIALRKIIPRKCAPPPSRRKKIVPGKLPPGKLPPEKLFYYFFAAFDIILRLLLLKIFIVTSFRGVSRTPATSIIDLLVTVVNGIN